MAISFHNQAPNMVPPKATEALLAAQGKLNTVGVAYAEVADIALLPSVHQRARNQYQAAWLEFLGCALEAFPEGASPAAWLRDSVREEHQWMVNRREDIWKSRIDIGGSPAAAKPQEATPTESRRRRFAQRLRKIVPLKKAAKLASAEPNWESEMSKQIAPMSDQPTLEELDRITRSILNMPANEEQPQADTVDPKQAVTISSEHINTLGSMQRRGLRHAAARAMALTGVVVVSALGVGGATSEKTEPGTIQGFEIGTPSMNKQAMNKSQLLCNLGDFALALRSKANMMEARAAAPTPPAPKWRAVTEGPKDVWAQKKDGDYKVFANPNSSKSNSIWTIAERVVTMDTGRAADQDQVRRIVEKTTELREAAGKKNPHLAAGEAVVITEETLEATA